MTVVPAAIEACHLEVGRPPAADSGRDLLLPVMLTGVAILGAFGAIGSFTNVAAVAEAGKWDRPWLLPAAVDGTIAFLTGLDFALARPDANGVQRKVGWFRVLAWALIGVTIALNVADKDGLFNILGHGVLPALFAGSVEAAKATLTASVVAHSDRIPLARWVCAPWPTFRLWRRMKVWGITSYAEALDLERRRFLARLIDRHGSLGAAPARKRELYRIIAAAAGIDVADQEEESAPALVEVAEAPERPPVTRPAPAERPPARRPVSRRSSAGPALTNEQIADKVDPWLTARRLDPTKDNVKAAGADLKLPCRGSSPATAVAAIIRARRSDA